jgi:hypothetical protein
LRFGNLAFVQVHDETTIGADKTDVELLLGLVPLGPDHDPVPVVVRLGAGDDRGDDAFWKSTDALEQVGDLFVFQFQLPGVVDVLILAAAAFAKVTALRSNAVGRGLDDANQSRAGEVLLHFGELGFDLFAEHDERNKHDKLLQSADAFAAKGDVRDGENDALTRRVR